MRRTLFDVAAMSATEEVPFEATPLMRPAAGRAVGDWGIYPGATVYLPRRASRLIKEIALEENRCISDILANAVDEYLAKRGQPSLSQFAD